MKRKNLFLIILMMICLLLSGCVSTLGTLPYGVWESEDPYILLDVPYEYDGRLQGKYEKDGEEIDIIFAFHAGYKGISIFDPSDVKGGTLNGDNPYFSGTYTYTKDRLIYKLKPYYAEIYGYKTITFTKIEDYEPELSEDEVPLP